MHDSIEDILIYHDVGIRFIANIFGEDKDVCSIQFDICIANFGTRMI